MANQLASFDPVGAFQRGRSNALAMQVQEADLALQPKRNALADFQMEQAKVGAQRDTTRFNQGQALQNAKILGQSIDALQQLPLQQRGQAFAVIEPELQKFGIDTSQFQGRQFTDEELAQGKVRVQSFIGSGGDPESFQKGATALVETETGPAFATNILNPKTGKTTTELSPIQGKLISKLGETGQEETLRKIEEAQGRAEVKGISERNQDIITRGVAAADSTASIRRGIQLLELVETGGIDRARLGAKQFFGIETADEGELTNLMGKAVLSQLRETFGAAFTAAEGQSLKGIEANLGKSAATNRTLLNNALRIAERSAKRAMDRAVKSEDFQTAADIQASLDFQLKDIEGGQPVEVTSQAQFDALPSGALFIEDGEQFRKP